MDDRKRVLHTQAKKNCPLERTPRGFTGKVTDFPAVFRDKRSTNAQSLQFAEKRSTLKGSPISTLHYVYCRKLWISRFSGLALFDYARIFAADSISSGVQILSAGFSASESGSSGAHFIFLFA